MAQSHRCLRAQPAVAVYFLAAAITGAALLLAGGCQREVPLQERVKAYWEARLAGDFQATFRLEEPETGIGEKEYLLRMAKGNILFRSYQTGEVSITDRDRAQVGLTLKYAIPGAPTQFESRLSDPWVKVGGQWYHLMPFKEPARKPAAEAPAS
jgi:hypothetical protein